VFAVVLVLLVSGKSLVQGEAMRTVVSRSMQSALGLKIRPNQCKGRDCTQKEVEDYLSNAIASADLPRRRDLVITVTLLNQTTNSDRYVYLPSNRNPDRTRPPPTYEERALALGQSTGLTFLNAPTNLMSFLVASGSVFPFFPARDFADPVGLGGKYQAVDGGFAHNSPIEAALDWGATHIVVIEASPTLSTEEGTTFGGNLGVAFDHLFGQAQVTDQRSRGQIEIYYIRPQKELLKTLEFIPHLMHQAIERGKTDLEQGQFVQFSRPPEFTELPDAPAGPAG